MTRSRSAVLALLLPLAATGCLSFSIDGSKDGLPRALLEVHRLEPGKSTLGDTLRRLGPPDLLLRVGDVDRLYYVAWDSLHFKFSVSAPLPLGRSVSTDAFILGLGSEDLRLARLEFDPAGILRDVQAGDFSSSSHGEYFAIDNRIVETFLEDRTRALALTDEDDDDDLEPRRMPPKQHE
jgi:hypothetical protein